MNLRSRRSNFGTRSSSASNHVLARRSNDSDPRGQQPRRIPTLRGVVASAVLAAALTACANTDADSLRIEAATVTEAASTEAPATTAPPANPRCDDSNPTRSFRPGDPTTPVVSKHLDEIRSRGKLIAGVDQDTLLFGYRNPRTGQIEGVDIDLLRVVATKIFNSDDPANLELRPVKYSDRVSRLEMPIADGGVDIVADTFTINCRRWARIAFSTQYFAADQKVLVAKTSPIASVADLSGKRVCMAAGATSIANLKAKNDKAVIVEVQDQTDCLILFQNSQVDAISTDDTILYGLAAQDPNTRIFGDDIAPEPYGIGIRDDIDSPEDPGFVRFVNGVLEEQRSNGGLQQIFQRWLGPVLGTNLPPVPAAQYLD